MGRVVEGLNGKEAMLSWTDFDPRGSVTLSVDAELQKAFEQNAGRYHFSLEKGWDVNKGCTGSGGGVFTA